MKTGPRDKRIKHCSYAYLVIVLPQILSHKCFVMSQQLLQGVQSICKHKDDVLWRIYTRLKISAASGATESSLEVKQQE